MELYTYYIIIIIASTEDGIFSDLHNHAGFTPLKCFCGIRMMSSCNRMTKLQYFPFGGEKLPFCSTHTTMSKVRKTTSDLICSHNLVLKSSLFYYRYRQDSGIQARTRIILGPMLQNLGEGLQLFQNCTIGALTPGQPGGVH